MATMYIKIGQLQKAEDWLKKVESQITGRDWIPYHYLICLYGTVGNKEETYRVWKTYKSVFPSIPNLGYHAMISSLVRIGDIEGAEKMYEEWLSVRTSFDPSIGNLLMNFDVKEGKLDKAEGILDQMVVLGGKPNSTTWEILAEGHTKERRISEAFSCCKDAFLADGWKRVRPKPVTLSSFFYLCEEEGNLETKEALVGLLRQSGFLEVKTYSLSVGLSNGALKDEAVMDPRSCSTNCRVACDVLGVCYFIICRLLGVDSENYYA